MADYSRRGDFAAEQATPAAFKRTDAGNARKASADLAFTVHANFQMWVASCWN